MGYTLIKEDGGIFSLFAGPINLLLLLFRHREKDSVLTASV